VDPDPDPAFLRKSSSAGNRTRTSLSVARNSDHYTTEAVTSSQQWQYIYAPYSIQRSCTMEKYSLTAVAEKKKYIYMRFSHESHIRNMS
jgi:hypothetical protein